MFDDVRMPIDIEKNTQGGIGFYTTIISSPSGNEQRNEHWEDDRGEWDISYGLARQPLRNTARNFFLGRRGASRSFRFRDWGDYKSGPINNFVPCFQGIGDGVTADWQLVKEYPDAINPYYRPIYKPDISRPYNIYVNGVVKPVTWQPHGIFRFAPANIPTAGQSITAEFEFDVPVRAVNDRIVQILATPEVMSLPSIKIVGVRPPLY